MCIRDSSYIVKWAIAINLVVMVGVVFYSVLSRNYFNTSIAWAEELSRILFIWLVFCGAILGLYYKEHLGLTVLVDRVKPHKKMFFDLLTCVLIIVVARAMIIGGIRITSATKLARTPALRLPTNIKYWPVLLGGFAMFSIAAENLFNSGIRLKEHYFISNKKKGE
jgi:TRAP-type C4-dicarboxylate transport system permease small subunit